MYLVALHCHEIFCRNFDENAVSFDLNTFDMKKSYFLSVLWHNSGMIRDIDILSEKSFMYDYHTVSDLQE